MNKAYLLIGGNMGNRLQNLGRAIELINESVGTVTKQSAIYETAPWGKTDQQSFLNQALLLETELPPGLLMERLLATELLMGRERLEKNGPRIIDIDILFYNDAVIDEPQLIVPHPAIQFRRFALIPMNEIASGLLHPVLDQRISELLANCADTLPVMKYHEHS